MTSSPSPTDDPTPEELAKLCADAMLLNDHATKGLNMDVSKVSPGAATLTMLITKNMLNGHGTCHGGFIFTLADSAFAFACNSHNQSAVAQHCSITYMAPGFEGDLLTATCTEVTRSGRSGIYDAKVMNLAGDCIAEFRGHARTIKGTLVDLKHVDVKTDA